MVFECDKFELEYMLCISIRSNKGFIIFTFVNIPQQPEKVKEWSFSFTLWTSYASLLEEGMYILNIQ